MGYRAVRRPQRQRQELIPSATSAEIREWNAVSERILAASRGAAMVRAVAEPRVLLEVLPPPLATLLGERGARVSARAFNAKYAIDASELQQYHGVVREELQRVQRALADGRRYLVGALSYADIAVGVALGVLGPLPGETVNGPQRFATLASDAEFVSLRAWRDALHAEASLLPALAA